MDNLRECLQPSTVDKQDPITEEQGEQLKESELRRLGDLQTVELLDLHDSVVDRLQVPVEVTRLKLLDVSTDLLRDSESHDFSNK